MKRILPILTIFLLSGCWDYSDAAMQEYVLGIGVDLIDDGYRVTIETADLFGSPESPSTAKLITCEGSNLFDAIRNAIPHAGKKLYWGHCSLVVIDDAIQGEHLHEVLDVLLRAQDVYQSIAVTIARDVSAEEFFKSDPIGSDSVTSHCLHIFQNQTSSRRFRKCELWEYVQSTDLALLPTVSLKNGVAQISGGAVYRDETLLGMLTGDEMLTLSLLSEDIRGGWIPSLPILPHTSISTEILAGTTKTNGEILSLTLTLAVSSSNTVFDLTDGAVRSSAEHTIAKFLERQGNALLLRAKQSGFSKLIHPTASQVDVSVRLRNSGMRSSEGDV